MPSSMIKTDSIPMSLTGGSARLPGRVKRTVEAVGHRAVVTAAELQAHAYVGHVGMTVVAASSAKQDELEPLLEIAGAKDVMDGWTSSDDAEESKPEPDIVHAALRKAGATPRQAVMIGDTPYDVAAAQRAGVRAIAFRSGGWPDADLAGAAEIYDGPADLLARLENSMLANGLPQSRVPR